MYAVFGAKIAGKARHYWSFWGMALLKSALNPLAQRAWRVAIFAVGQQLYSTMPKEVGASLDAQTVEPIAQAPKRYAQHFRSRRLVVLGLFERFDDLLALELVEEFVQRQCPLA